MPDVASTILNMILAVVVVHGVGVSQRDGTRVEPVDAQQSRGPEEGALKLHAARRAEHGIMDEEIEHDMQGTVVIRRQPAGDAYLPTVPPQESSAGEGTED